MSATTSSNSAKSPLISCPQSNLWTPAGPVRRSRVARPTANAPNIFQLLDRLLKVVLWARRDNDRSARAWPPLRRNLPNHPSSEPASIDFEHSQGVLNAQDLEGHLSAQSRDVNHLR